MPKDLIVKDAYGKDYPLAEMAHCVGPGWGQLIGRLYKICGDAGVTVTQVKEKWGGLRFYVAHASPEIYAEIDRAEDESLRTCELCGDVGSQIESAGWVRTRCAECNKKRGKEGHE